jgi:hypothetical protein
MSANPSPSRSPSGASEFPIWSSGKIRFVLPAGAIVALVLPPKNRWSRPSRFWPFENRGLRDHEIRITGLR